MKQQRTAMKMRKTAIRMWANALFHADMLSASCAISNWQQCCVDSLLATAQDEVKARGGQLRGARLKHRRFAARSLRAIVVRIGLRCLSQCVASWRRHASVDKNVSRCQMSNDSVQGNIAQQMNDKDNENRIEMQLVKAQHEKVLSALRADYEAKLRANSIEKELKQKQHDEEKANMQKEHEVCQGLLKRELSDLEASSKADADAARAKHESDMALRQKEHEVGQGLLKRELSDLEASSKMDADSLRAKHEEHTALKQKEHEVSQGLLKREVERLQEKLEEAEQLRIETRREVEVHNAVKQREHEVAQGILTRQVASAEARNKELS